MEGAGVGEGVIRHMFLRYTFPALNMPSIPSRFLAFRAAIVPPFDSDLYTPPPPPTPPEDEMVKLEWTLPDPL